MTILSAIRPFITGRILFDSEEEKAVFLKEKNAHPTCDLLGGYGMKYSYTDKRDNLYRDFIAVVKV